MRKITSNEIAELIERAKLSMEEFSAFLGIHPSTARKWLENAARPSATANSLLLLLCDNPDSVSRLRYHHKVVAIPVKSEVNTLPDNVLGAAVDAGMENVTVAGFDLDGAFYIASSETNIAETLYHLERGRHTIHKIIDDIEDGKIKVD